MGGFTTTMSAHSVQTCGALGLGVVPQPQDVLASRDRWDLELIDDIDAKRETPSHSRAGTVVAAASKPPYCCTGVHGNGLSSMVFQYLAVSSRKKEHGPPAQLRPGFIRGPFSWR